MKPSELAKLLSDNKAVPDDFVIKLANGAEVSFGDLRAYDKERGGELQAEITRQQNALAKDQEALKTASERVAKTYIELEAEKQRLAAAAAGGGGGRAAGSGEFDLSRYETDEVFGPVVKHFKAQQSATEKKLEEALTKLDTAVKSIGQMGITYMGDKAASDFQAIMAQDDPVRPKDLNLDNLYKMAVEQRIYDRNNLPDLRETYKRLTADARRAHDLAEAEKRGREAVIREQQEASMLPPPTGGGQFSGRERGEAMPKNLNDAFGKATQDRELWKEINQPNLIGGGAIQ